MAAGRTPGWLGDENAAQALDVLVRGGALSRNGIAAALRVSKQTAAQIVSRLQERELIVEVGQESVGRGPSAAVYAARADLITGVAVNVDEHGITSCVVDALGTAGPIAHRPVAEIAEPRSAGRDIADAVAAAVQAARADAAAVGRVCIGVPSSIDPRTDELSSVDSLPGWSRHRVTERLQAALGCAVRIDNDVNLAVTAERAAGDFDPDSSIALIWLGHGIGLAVDIGGRVLHGSSGGAGEIGHLRVRRTVAASVGGDADDAVDLEETVGGAAVDEIAGFGLFAQLRAGAVLPGPVAAELAERVAPAVTSVIGVLDPDHLVLGGPVGRAGAEVLAELTSAAVAASSRWRPAVEVSAVEGDAVLRGAIELLRDDLREDLIDRARRTPARTSDIHR